ncbi:MAG: Rne/Rng family ribonuclease, partial [Verrucomicrobiota bacterium]
MSQTFKKGRGGMSFKPNRNLPPQRPERAANRARLEAIGAKSGDESVFDIRRHEAEIRRSENLAAGLPADAREAAEDAQAPVEGARDQRFRQPDLSRPEEADEGPETPPTPPPAPKGLLDKARAAVQEVVKHVRRLIQPEPKMVKEVIINAEPLETRVAVIEEGRLEEFTVERASDSRLVGSIFKGKVRNLEDNLKAAFVDIGFEKNAFLHYWDIIPNNFDSSVEIIERDDRKKKPQKPKITQKDVPRLYPPGSEIIIQVTKDAIGTKGPRVTTNLSLPGRYLVLLPNSEQSGISRKIENHEERQRLKKIVRELNIPEGMGVIVRTAGEGKLKRYFIRDLAMLLEEWKGIHEKIQNQPPATCVFQEPDLIERTVRDFLTEDVTRIVIDNPKQFESMKEAIERISKRSARKVHFYNEAQPLFDRFGITRQLEQAFSRTVHLKGGGYIVIDETEALVAIDVNTGKHKGGKDHDQAILKVNLEAADEICRQLRLRNIGGIIVLDFIDMKSRKD